MSQSTCALVFMGAVCRSAFRSSLSLRPALKPRKRAHIAMGAGSPKQKRHGILRVCFALNVTDLGATAPALRGHFVIFWQLLRFASHAVCIACGEGFYSRSFTNMGDIQHVSAKLLFSCIVSIFMSSGIDELPETSQRKVQLHTDAKVFANHLLDVVEQSLHCRRPNADLWPKLAAIAELMVRWFFPDRIARSQNLCTTGDCASSGVRITWSGLPAFAKLDPTDEKDLQTAWPWRG